jgi:hypothetical protein
MEYNYVNLKYVTENFSQNKMFNELAFFNISYVYFFISFFKSIFLTRVLIFSIKISF